MGLLLTLSSAVGMSIRPGAWLYIGQNVLQDVDFMCHNLLNYVL